MNESTEETSYLQKILTLAQSSGKYVERLWHANIDFSRFGDFISPIFSSIYSTLVQAATHVTSYSETMRKLYLNRLMFIPPFNLMVEKPAPTEDGFAPIHMGKANVAFLFNVIVANKNARKLTERLLPRTPKPVATTTSLVGAEEAAKNMPEIVTTFQYGFNSKIAPSMKGMTSILRRVHSSQLASPLRMTSKPVKTSQVESASTYPMGTAPEKEVPQSRLSEDPSVSSFPQEVNTEILAVVSIPVFQFEASAARSVGYAARLPRTLMQQGSPILANLAAFPTVSAESAEAQVSMPFEESGPKVVGSAVLSKTSPETAAPTMAPSPCYVESAAFPLMGISPLSTTVKEISPYLSALAYSVSRAVRATVPRISAVPAAASTAAKFVRRTLLQRVSSVEAPKVLSRSGHALSRPKIEGKPIEVEAFRLPQMVTSLFVGLSQQYPLLSDEAEIGEALASTIDMTVVPEETLLLDTMPEMKTISKLSTAITSASSERLVAQSLKQEPGSLNGGLYIARSLPAETFGVRTFSPLRATNVSGMAGASRLASRGKPVPWGPSGPPRTPNMGPAHRTVQNTFNITLAEAKDADLRDLERKINRILSEQIRRYYGSTKI